MRLIARLDIKGENLIKGLQFEGLRILGDPNKFALEYYKRGIDEIFFVDTVASLYGRNNLTEIIARASENIFVPITAGGGIRNLQDAKNIFNSGADKIFLNTYAIKNPKLITELVDYYGSQSIVVSIEAKRTLNNQWECYTLGGREKTGINLLNWVEKIHQLKAGEIFLTSIDNDGLMNGLNKELFEIVSKKCDLPLMFGGGFKNENDLKDLNFTSCDGIFIGSSLHYKKVNIEKIKSYYNESKKNCNN
jgi:imidazoleglycerol phosphate synthase cyclase subunit